MVERIQDGVGTNSYTELQTAERRESPRSTIMSKTRAL